MMNNTLLFVLATSAHLFLSQWALGLLSCFSYCEQWCCEQSGTCLLVNLACFSTEASQVALVVKNMPASAGDIRDVGSIPGLR